MVAEWNKLIYGTGMFFLAVMFLLICLVPGSGFCGTGLVIAFGDSLTEGCDVQGAGSCGWVGGTGYEEELQVLLNQGGNTFVVNNYGRGGETTTEGVNRLDAVLTALCNQDADYLLLLEGTNDLLHEANGLDVKFNLGIMIDKCRARGIEPVLATITPDLEPEHAYKDVPLMNEYIRALAREKKVHLVDLYGAMAPRWREYTNYQSCYKDLTHPNPTGFDVMGGVWYEGMLLLPAQTGDAQPFASSAVLSGTVTSDMLADGERVFFQYGRECALTETIEAVSDGQVDGDGRLVFTAYPDALIPETTYCYRLISSKNGVLLHTGWTLTFTTLPRAIPWTILLLRK